MTAASPSSIVRHDNVTPVTGRSGQGTARQTIRVNEALWVRFGQAAGEQGTDRSALLREFIRWYVRDAGAKLPGRPSS